MNLLLDTHAFVWWDSDKTQLSPGLLAAFFDLRNKLFLSVVSVWEIQIVSRRSESSIYGCRWPI